MTENKYINLSKILMPNPNAIANANTEDEDIIRIKYRIDLLNNIFKYGSINIIINLINLSLNKIHPNTY